MNHIQRDDVAVAENGFFGQDFQKVVAKIRKLMAARQQEEQEMSVLNRLWNRLTHAFKFEGFKTDAELMQILLDLLICMKSKQMLDYFKAVRSRANDLVFLVETIPDPIVEQLSNATKEEIEGYAKNQFAPILFEHSQLGKDYFSEFVAACSFNQPSQRREEVLSALLKGLSQRVDFLPMFIDIYRNIKQKKYHREINPEELLSPLLLQKIAVPLAEQFIDLYGDANFRSGMTQHNARKKLKEIKDKVRVNYQELKELEVVFVEAIIDHYMGNE